MSVPNPSLPGIRQALLDGSSASRPFYLFWQWTATNLPSVAAAVDDLTVKVDALSGNGGISPDAGIRGSFSIITQGTLAAGIVQIGLQGDVASPAFTQYYGSDTTGAKGWFNVSDTLAVTSYLTKTVADTGVTTFDLTDAGNTNTGTLQAITVDAKGRVTGLRDATITGTDGRITVTHGDASDGLPTIDLAVVTDVGGGTLQRTAFDTYGRKTGTSAATTTDLAEGTNLYFTDARADARIAVAKADPDGIASLQDGKLDPGQLPALAITSTFVVNTEAAMLALDCQQGDVAVRTDLSQSFIMTADPPTTLANWQELLTPTGGVNSFNGRTGAVTPASGDYTFAQIGSKPTTLAGYGITDAATSAQGALADTALQDAPSDGTIYGRQDGAWVAAGGGGASMPPGYIDGLQMQWVSGTALTVSSGSAYIESAGAVLSAASAVAKTGLTLTASTWYHVYLYDNAGTPDVEIVTTTPGAPYNGTARSKTGDTSRRYLGSIRTDATGDIYNFDACGDQYLWRFSYAAVSRALSGGTSTTAVTVSLATFVAPTSTRALLSLFNGSSTASNFVQNGWDGGTFAQFNAIAAGGTAVMDFVVSPSQQMQYRFNPAPTAGGGYIDVIGFVLER